MENKRVEATIDDWAELYQNATLLQEMEPWNMFWDVELISVWDNDTQIFISILGRGGDTFGITCYEGREGLRDFAMLAECKAIGITPEYAMFSQNCLTCYWGDREELSTKQREIIKELGYKYRGRNKWLYFMSFKDGYFPHILDKNEVNKLTRYYTNLIRAIEFYKNNSISVNFERGQYYEFYYDESQNAWQGVASELPPNILTFNGISIADEILIAELKQAKRNTLVLEADMFFSGVAVKDKELERPANPRLCLIVDHKTGMILGVKMVKSDEIADYEMVSTVVEYILQHGAPKKIIFRSFLIESLLMNVCEICGIETETNSDLRGVDEFIEGFQ